MIEDDEIIIDQPRPARARVKKRPDAEPAQPDPQPPRRSRAKGAAAKPKRKMEPWMLTLVRVCNAMVLAINCLAAIGLCLSGYAHRISPQAWGPASLVAMTFPAFMLGALVLFALDLAWWKRTAWVPGLAMMACLGPIHDFMPLNLPHFGMSEAQKESSFTLMTYNVMGFDDFQKKGLDYNRQLAYILEKQPDVACLQEAHYLAPNATNRITQEQLDQLHHIYPYVLTQGHDFALLSKYQAQPINLDFPASDFASGGMAAWRLFIKGRVVNVFSVHLRSFGLSDEDKSAYEDIVRLDSLTRSDLRDAKREIWPKVKEAGIERAEQIAYLQKYLNKYGGRDAIVCGDFNDPVLCYGLYKLGSESHMRQVYAEAGFGPAITFHANDLYFRIDHILYRGQMTPWRIKRCGIGASDHYPLMATMILQ